MTSQWAHDEQASNGEVLMTATRIAMTSEDWQQRHAAAVLLRDLALSCRLAGASCEAAQEAGPGEEAPAGSGAQGLPGMRAQEWARHATRAADVLCEMLNDVQSFPAFPTAASRTRV